ncbi:MAG: hypothetical protein WC845_03280 [Candidatus Staskawiczbacteria bacterium]|jgi:hypothetical protein
MKIVTKIIAMVILFVFLFLVLWFFLGSAPKAKNILWGVNFSQKHTENLKLDWKETYLAMMEDLGAKNIKLTVDWDWVNGERDGYFFDDVDWQIREAEEHDVNILLSIGMKTSRWPECHIPSWAKDLSKDEREAEVLKYLEKMVLRYRGSSAVTSWQVENEPFFPFGECPPTDEKFLAQEVELVKSLDSKKRPIIISDTGEFSLWFKAAKYGDIVGNTLYKKVWSKEAGNYFYAPFPPLFYYLKAQLVRAVFHKPVECGELQAEPWGPELLYDLPLSEQEKTMDLERFKKNVEFAERTGLDTFYFWGNEWWYWLKEKQNQPEIWNEAKKLFK